jgi:phage-related tail protein
MSEEEKKEEKQEQPQGNPEQIQENPNNGAPTAEDTAAIKAQLEEEKKAIADAQTLLAQKDTRIAELEAQLSEAQQTIESLRAEGVAISEVRDKAVSKYLEVTRALNDTIPSDVIAGSTIEEIDASVAKALSIATAVKASLEAQAKEAKVPAGAPPRGEISLEGLSPREKIAAGIQSGSQK